MKVQKFRISNFEFRFFLLLTLVIGPWTLDAFSALSDNLISYWALNEASGTRVDKVVASANDLSNSGSAPTQAVGNVYANAAQFTSASSQWFSRADNASISLGSTAFTVIAWVYLNSVSSTQEIYSKDDGGTVREIAIDHQNGGTFRFRTWTATGNVGNNDLSATTSLPTPAISTWYMIACTSDLTTKKISVNAGTQDSVAAANAGWDSNKTLYIGSQDGIGTFFNGRIGPVMFFKRALSSVEISAIYNSGNGLTYEAMTTPAPSPPPQVTLYNNGAGLTYEGVLGTGIIPHPLTSGSDSTGTSGGTVFTTASVTIHANRLALLAYQYARDSGLAGTLAVTSTGANWVLVGTGISYHTNATPTRSVKLFRTMVAFDQTSAITITHSGGNVQDGAAWSLVEFEGVPTGGTDGSAAIVQSSAASGGSGSTTVSCSLSAFSDATNNVAFGALGTSQSAGITPGSGFIELHDVTYATPSNELQTEYRTGQDTSVDATFGAADCGCQAVEIASLTIAGSGSPLWLSQQQRRRR